MQFQYSDKARGMKPSIIRELLKQMADPTLISFAGGNPDAEAFPDEAIRKISDELLREEPAATLQYNITEGYPPLRVAAKKYLNGIWDVVKDTDELLVTSGSQQVMDFLTKLLCNEGDVVATEDPAFLGALNSFRSHGVQLIGVPLEEDGVDLAALEAVLSGDVKPRFFYTIPNFQNPTGVTMSLEKRKAVYALCAKHSVPILEDNPYGELRFSGEALPPIKAFDEEGLVVYAASLSKVLAPGLRLAFCVGAADLMNKMVVAKQSNDVHTNVWAQRVCERFLNEYDMDEHLARLRKIYRAKALHMMKKMDAAMAGRIHYLHPDGGMFLWITLPPQVNMLKYVQACLDEKLALVPGNAFFVDDEVPCQSFRANFTMPSMAQIDEGVEIMARVLAQMGG